jgi:hypothetical protein
MKIDPGERSYNKVHTSVRSAASAAEAKRQCARVNAADRTDHLIDWVEMVSAFDDDAAR